MPIKDPFLAGVLATVPEAERAKAEARLIELEEGGLRQADYSRLSAEAQAAKKAADDLLAKNQEWFTERKAALEEVDSLRARVANGNPNPEPTPKPDFKLPDDVITKKALKEHTDNLERGAVGFIAESNALVMKHFKEFGDILDINELLQDPKVQQIGLRGVYAEKFKDQITKKATEAENARAEAFRLEGEKRAMERLATQRGPGYPVVGNEPSSLDAIETAIRSGDGKVQVKSLDDMAAEYARLSSTRSGSASP